MNSHVSSGAPNADDETHSVVDLGKLQQYASMCLSRTCTQAEKLTHGRSYDIYVLHFAMDENHVALTIEEIQGEQWSCIARVSRTMQPVAQMLSEVETMRYIKSHTSIPIPDVYSYDFDANNAIGAQFMLIERLPGVPLNQVWDQLHIDDKKSIMSDIAKALVELSSLRFDKIGFLNADGHIGPLLYPLCNGQAAATGPFTSTIDYFVSFLLPDANVPGPFAEARSIVESHESINSNSSLAPPFRIIHDDLVPPNFLLMRPETHEHCQSPQTRHFLSGIIDWEYAQTGPLYFFYDYPIFIQDTYEEPDAYVENKILRTHFVEAITQQFPDGSLELDEVLKSMDKNFTISGFKNRIIGAISYGKEAFEFNVRGYVIDHEQRTGRVYEGGPEQEVEEELSDERSTNTRV